MQSFMFYVLIFTQLVQENCYCHQFSLKTDI